jgi:hypothetical protein
MGSNDAKALATQQSIKAYADSVGFSVADSSWDKFMLGAAGTTAQQIVDHIDETATEVIEQAAEPDATSYYPGCIWIDTDADPAVGAPIIDGLVQRAEFEYKDANEVTVKPGTYHHDGTTEQYVYWTTNYDVTVTGTSGWNYLYIDDSAIVTAGTNVLTASEFIFSTTAPTYDGAKQGWYNGSDRCIFATFCTAASTQSIFYHDGGDYVQYDSAWVTDTNLDPDSSWVDVTMKAPAFCTRAELWCLNEASASTGIWYYRKNGSSATTGHWIGYSQSGEYNAWGGPVYTDASQIIELRKDRSNANNLDQVTTRGWYIPRGM